MSDIIEFTFPTVFFLFFLLVIYLFKIQPKASTNLLRITNIGLVTSLVSSALLLILAIFSLYLVWTLQQIILWCLLLFTALSFLFRKELKNGFNQLYRRLLLGAIGIFTVFCIGNLMGILLFFDINKPFVSEDDYVVFNDSTFKLKYLDAVLARSYSPTLFRNHFLFYRPVGKIMDFPREELISIEEIKQLDNSCVFMKYIKIGGESVDTLIHLDNRR